MDPQGQIRMTTRSRTLLFLSYRNSLARPPQPLLNGLSTESSMSHVAHGDGRESTSDERQGLMAHNDDRTVDMSVLPPKWVDTVDDIQDTIKTIVERMKALDKLHRKHVLPGFDDRTAEEREIERLTREITSLFHRAQSSIKRIAIISAEEVDAGAAEQEAVMSKNVQTSLATTIQELSSGFRKKQSTYIQKLKGQEAAEQAFSKAKGKGEFIEDDLETGFSSQQLALVENQEASIEHREKEINSIAKSIIELAEIFKDLQTFVIDQGTLLDRIDYNVENMVTHVKEAVVQLDEGAKSQKRARKRKFIFLLILIIIGLVIVIIFKPKGRHIQNVPSPPTINPAPDPTITSKRNIRGEDSTGYMRIRNRLR